MTVRLFTCLTLDPSKGKWGRGPRLREVALHLGLERELWLLRSLGCHLSTPLAWQSGLKKRPRLGCVWGWGNDRVRDTEGQGARGPSGWWRRPGSVFWAAELGWEHRGSCLEWLLARRLPSVKVKKTRKDQSPREPEERGRHSGDTRMTPRPGCSRGSGQTENQCRGPERTWLLPSRDSHQWREQAK